MEKRTALLKMVRDSLSLADLYVQLAEECSELAQASLKLARYYSGTNPPAIMEERALQ